MIIQVLAVDKSLTLCVVAGDSQGATETQHAGARVADTHNAAVSSRCVLQPTITAHDPSPLLAHTGCTVEPVLCGLCHERPLILNDRFHKNGLFLIDVCTTCYERPLFLGRRGGLTRQALLYIL